MINETLFPVKEIPAIWADKKNGNILNKETGHKFIIRQDTGEILSCMTDEYKLVSNKEIMDTALPILKKCGAKPREAKVLNDGKRTVWKFNIPSIKVLVSEGDMGNPEIIIKNSYDGSWELGIMGGAFRLVCENGMIIGILLTKKSNRHSIYNPNIENLESMIVDTIESTSKVFKEDFTLLKETKVNPKHTEKMIEMIPSNVMEPFVQYLLGHKPENYWDLFNAATWVNTHHMNRNYSTTHKFESQIYPAVSRWAKDVARA